MFYYNNSKLNAYHLATTVLIWQILRPDPVSSNAYEDAISVKPPHVLRKFTNNVLHACDAIMVLLYQL